MGQDLLGRTFWQGLDAKQCLEAPHLHLLPSVLRLPVPAANCSLSLGLWWLGTMGFAPTPQICVGRQQLRCWKA